VALREKDGGGLTGRRERVVLFLSASVGEGHTAAAHAVCAALREEDAQTRCEVVDSYRYASEVFHKVASNGYVGIVKILPQLYRFVYDQAERATKVSAFKKWLYRYTATNLRQLVGSMRPDVIVCTHAFPCGVMAEYKREFPDAPPVVGIVTDFVVHPFWIHRNIDGYAVATSAMRQVLIARGVPEARVAVTGIPVDQRFGRNIAKREVRRRLGIDPDGTTLLLMGGGLGIGPLEKSLVGLDQLQRDFQAVVVVGKNPALQRRLTEAARKLRHPVTVVGFVPNVFDYMRAADILVSKPGGLTSSESLAAGLPLVMLKPLPGQEERNTRYLEESGVGICVHTSKELVQALDRLLGDAASLEQMRTAARRLARPDAAAAVADMIAGLARLVPESKAMVH
jgi:processive 1,2-diacylglycerol beta-glucosyltransferase